MYLSSPEMSQLSTDEDSFDWKQIKKDFVSFVCQSERKEDTHLKYGSSIGRSPGIQ